MAGRTKKTASTNGAPATTKGRIVEAAFATLRDEGYSGASARAIAGRGKFNQALIFYHFGGVDEALLAALDLSSEQRLARYREVFGEALTLEQMAGSAWELFKEDLDSGHVKVLGELIAAGSSNPELGRQVASRVEPSLAFTRETFQRVMGSSPLSMFVSVDDAAFALTSLYLGLELMCNLEQSTERAESLFATAGRLAVVFGAMVAPAGQLVSQSAGQLSAVSSQMSGVGAEQAAKKRLASKKKGTR